MGLPRKPWQQELEIVDRTMVAISSVSDPEEMVQVYWDGIGELIPSADYTSLSLRGVEPPYYLITRSSRFTRHLNPWTQRDLLPKLSGGLLGELAYAAKPVVLDDIPSLLKPDDPGWFYLQGFQSLVSLPQYDNGKALNTTVMLLEPGLEIDHAMIPVLHWQSGLFGRGTQTLVLRNQLANALNALDRELQVVGEMQRSLLPSKLPEIPGFDVAAYYQTSARAGGDYYDFFPLDKGQWGVLIADVSGHGTPAAVLMAITRAIAHALPSVHSDPGRLLCHLNTELTRSYTREGTFVTAFYGVLDPASRTFRYSSAGHNPPRLARGGRNRVEALDRAADIPIGIDSAVRYEQAEVTLERGDFLLLYTDGITEAMGAGDSNTYRPLFGVEGVDRLLINGHGRPATDCLDRIRAEVAVFTDNAPAADDQTLVAMRCL
jgi:sigma-B regulation protein RsbU (phosphoserine phosphatase)